MARSLVGGLGLTLAALTLGLAWSGGWSAGRGSVARASTDPETSSGATGQPEGLVVRLSEVPSEAPPAPAETVAPSRPLSDAEAEKVLDRLPPLHVEEEDERPFALRDKSLPPPRTGATVKEPFETQKVCRPVSA